MREIKFRAWHKRYRMMFSFVEHCTWSDGSSAVTMVGNGLERDIPEKGDIELMQYTGLKDKHGKEIYEGDIIAWAGAYNHKMVVRWIEKGLYFDVPLQWIQDIEVIGNIYENAELMQGMDA